MSVQNPLTFTTKHHTERGRHAPTSVAAVAEQAFSHNPYTLNANPQPPKQQKAVSTPQQQKKKAVSTPQQKDASTPQQQQQKKAAAPKAPAEQKILGQVTPLDPRPFR